MHGRRCKEDSNCLHELCYRQVRLLLFVMFIRFRNPLFRTSPPEQSRKWGVYVVGLVLKSYFRVCLTLYLSKFAELSTDQENVYLQKHFKSTGGKSRHSCLIQYPRSHQVCCSPVPIYSVAWQSSFRSLCDTILECCTFLTKKQDYVKVYPQST